MIENKKTVILSYLVTVLPATLSFYQLFVLYQIDIAVANIFYKNLSLILLLTSILALNTNYVYMLREGNQVVKTKSEYTILALYRIFSYLIIVVPLIIIENETFSNSIKVIIFGLFKLLIEIVNNFFRAKNLLKDLQRSIIFNVLIDFIVLCGIFYFHLLDYYTGFILGYIIYISIIWNRIQPHLGLKDLKNTSSKIIKYYLEKIGPLSISSIRENLSSQGVTYFSSSALSNNEYALLVNAIKIFSSGTILLGVLSNYYMQHIFRTGKRKFRDEILLTTAIGISLIFLKLILSFTDYFEGVGNKISWFLIFLFYLGIILNLNYTIIQGLYLKNKNFLSLYFFEFSFILTTLICFKISVFETFFLSGFYSYLVSTLILILSYEFIHRRRTQRNSI